MRALCLLSLSIGLFTSVSGALGGPTEPPPGPVGPTMKTLAQVEPRTPVSAATTPGDNVYPPSVFKITQPGSYYLTGSFQVPADGVGVYITCNDVTLDLNGFTISSGAAGVYAVSAGGPGVLLSNIHVRNGAVKGATGFGVGVPQSTSVRIDSITVIDCDTGVYTGEGCVMVNCIAERCGEGLQLGDKALVRDCVAKECDNLGIYLGDGSAASGCLALNNGSYGYILGNGSTLTASVARGNGTVGIGALQDCVIADCSAQANGTDGVTTGQGCVVRHTASGESGRHGFAVIAGTSVEGCTARRNGEDGINATWQCRLVGNTCQGNGVTGAAGAGIRVTSWGSRIEDNTLFGNDKGLVVSGTDNFIARNTAKNTGNLNYEVVAGNEFAPVITSPGTTFTAATPWTNFGY